MESLEKEHLTQPKEEVENVQMKSNVGQDFHKLELKYAFSE